MEGNLIKRLEHIGHVQIAAVPSAEPDEGEVNLPGNIQGAR